MACLFLFVFNCRHDYGVKHFQISQVDQDGETMYVLDQQFRSLQDLVKFYSEHDVPNMEGIAGVRLTVPVVCSSDETISLQHILTLRRCRSMSDGEAANHQDAVDCRRCECRPGAVRWLQHSVSESQSDDALSSKRSSWSRLFSRSPKKKSRNESTRVQLVTSQLPGEFGSSTRQSSSSLTEKPKKYKEQPAIPDDSAGPAIPSMRKISSQPSALFTDDAGSAANSDIAAAAASEDMYYSTPRDTDREQSDDLIKQLSLQDQQDVKCGKCVCGLYLVDSELPRGWSMHISTEHGTEGRLFFTSPTGETSWELPTIVSVDLDPDQQDRIRQLMIAARHFPVNRHFADGEKRISV